MLNALPFTITSLHEAYAHGNSPVDVVAEVYRRLGASADSRAFISTYSQDVVADNARALGAFDPNLPLWGIPFAIKDNIDAAGLNTTAGCPAFAYKPERDAAVVASLRQAGALLIGKTNLDQFATGLVGTRSPWGACVNPFDPRYISGGSSSGSAVAVSLGAVTFSLGTDTAGSGRVPAAFNNIVGLKPSVGRISTRGVVPACKTLDCVSVFALTPDDAYRVLDVAGIRDDEDPWSRDVPQVPALAGRGFTFAVPDEDGLEFFGDKAYSRAFEHASHHLASLGGTRTRFDYTPFAETGSLLYEGPWVAERLHAANDLVEQDQTAVLPVIRTILEGARQFDALDTFEGFYRLQELKRQCTEVWRDADCLLLPTAPTHPTMEAVEREPIMRNKELGLYTNFVNLLDLCAVAVPAGFVEESGLPFGVSLVAPAGCERRLTDIAARLQSMTTRELGATDHAVPANRTAPASVLSAGLSQGNVQLAVCGAHLSGQPLNHQLTERGAVLVASTTTAPNYRLFALDPGQSGRPGLLRAERGARIEVEVWELPAKRLGSFVDSIKAPLGFGRVELTDGRDVLGFLCEEYATHGAVEITEFGGWRAYLANIAV